ncbi:MAG TPA: glycosyltransferase family 9 protein [Casimicrobiaceae bacterium]|nr:glycosyltransferase family 9 protein [Casimicrobiaceae bacterium]
MACAWRDAESVLALRLDGMGDLLMTTPALRALKEALPSRRLALLTSPQGAAIGRELPFVDDVIVFDAPWVKSGDTQPSSSATTALIRRLHARAYDAAIVFTVYSQSALPAAMLLYQAGVPLRAAHCRENPYALLTHWQADPDRDPHAGVRHEVERQIDLVASLGVDVVHTCLQFPVRAGAKRSMRAKALAAGLSSQRPWLVVHPGATAASRRYPVASLALAVAALAESGRWQVVIAGGGADVAAAKKLTARVPGAVSLAGALGIAELAALLQDAETVVCNNSVAAHLCAAVGTPVVDLYALTNPQHTPWQVAHRTLSHDVSCRYCLKSTCPLGHHRCLAGVAPDAIVEAVTGLAATSARRGVTSRGSDDRVVHAAT